MEDILFGPPIPVDVIEVYYTVTLQCFPSSIDRNIRVRDRVEVFGKYEVPICLNLFDTPICDPPEVNLCNSGYIIKFPPGPIDWEESGIFPNPVIEHTATLYIDGYVSSVTLLIFDLAGQKVVEETYSTNPATVDLSDLDNGLYLYVLIVEQDEDTPKSPVKKLLVQR